MTWLKKYGFDSGLYVVLHFLLKDLNHWVTRWLDWNLVLDEQGGPSWVGKELGFADSSIIINKTANEFYKQPMYYAMGHFSKYIPENSVRIDINVVDKQLFGTAFLRPDGMRVVVILNR